MKTKSTVLFIAATAITFLAGAQSAQAHHLRFLHFPHIFSHPAPDYGYDNYDEDYPVYEGDVAYANPGYADDYADPYYVPRRKHRSVESDMPKWWQQEPQRKHVNRAQTLEPIPYRKSTKRKVTVAAAPVPKLAPTFEKRKVAPLALAPEAKPVVTKPAKPKIETASLTPAKPAPTKAIGCTAGAAIVTGYGFANVTPKVCTGNIYAYNAQRDGKPYVIKLTAAQGEITEVTKQ